MRMMYNLPVLRGAPALPTYAPPPLGPAARRARKEEQEGDEERLCAPKVVWDVTFVLPGLGCQYGDAGTLSEHSVYFQRHLAQSRTPTHTLILQDNVNPDAFAVFLDVLHLRNEPVVDFDFFRILPALLSLCRRYECLVVKRRVDRLLRRAFGNDALVSRLEAHPPALKVMLRVLAQHGMSATLMSLPRMLMTRVDVPDEAVAAWDRALEALPSDNRHVVALEREVARLLAEQEQAQARRTNLSPIELEVEKMLDMLLSPPARLPARKCRVE